jgi:hypothetical protein
MPNGVPFCNVTAMSTQRLTIAKIAGAASVATIDLFRTWRSARLIEDQEWSPNQWPQQVRLQADEWALRMRQNAHKPPVLFFAEYVDMWSFAPPRVHIGNDQLIQVVADRYEVFCLQLPAATELVSQLRRLRREGQWFEDRLFGKVTIEAMAAWRKLIDMSAIVFLREILGGSIEDHEVEQSLEQPPEWFLRRS